MIKIDLITGFLGSGKTTFIKKYAKYLIEKGEHIGILENDFGAVNVDMMLLQELESDNCELEMVSSGFDADCHKRRFKTKLIAMAMCGYDRIIVEPSGIYDVDEFFDTLCEEPLDKWYTIGNVITIVNADIEPDLTSHAKYILATQACAAGRIILSRLSLTNEQSQIDKAVITLNEVLNEHKINRDINDIIIRKDLLSLTDKDFDTITSSGYYIGNYDKTWSKDNSGFESLYFLNKKYTINDFVNKAKEIIKNKKYGNVLRLKGFLQLSPLDNLDDDILKDDFFNYNNISQINNCTNEPNSRWLQVNITRNTLHIEYIPNGQEVLIVIGEDLNKEQLNEIFV